MKKQIRILGISLILLFVGLTFNTMLDAQGSQSPSTKGKTVFKVVKSNQNTTHFAQLLKTSGYSKVLKSKGPYTVLAPSNKALKSSGYDQAKDNPAKAKKIIRGQLYKGNVSASKVKSNMGVKILDTDKSADNGTVYVVNKVIRQGSSKQ